MVQADSGGIGGKDSNEFVLLTDSGEDMILISDKGGYAANVEKAVFEKTINPIESIMKIEKISTTNITTIDQLSKLQNISKTKISIPMVNVTGIIQVTTQDANGINLIKDSMSQVLSSKTGKKVEISYLGSPKYKITVYSEDYKKAEKNLTTALEKIKKSIGKKGTFSFSKEQK